MKCQSKGGVSNVYQQDAFSLGNEEDIHTFWLEEKSVT